VFACGGGGWAEHGRELGMLAVTIGRPELVSIDELPDDEWIATAAAIGAPAGLTAWQMLGVDYVRAVERLVEALGEPVAGLIVGQNGMSSTLNAWLPAALLGVKVIDAVADIRAHPTGDMGSLGLASSPEPTIQTAVGGNRTQDRYLDLVVRGSTRRASMVLRTAADQAGGFIASCRNPVRARLVRERAALGGISRAIALGQRIAAAEPRGATAVIDAICEDTGGRIVAAGRVTRCELGYTPSAFDVGRIEIADTRQTVTLRVMNEYMTIERGDEWLGGYPDVITLLDEGAHPLSAGRVREGARVHLLHVPAAQLPLASALLDPALYGIVAETIGVDLVPHLPRLARTPAEGPR
jgi:DUF917 family protein